MVTSSRATAGKAIRATSASGGATRTAIASARRSAICLGTSSPMISDPNVMNATPAAKATPEASAGETPGNATQNDRQRRHRTMAVVESAPTSTPTRVTPVWTVDRNRPGFCARRNAVRAPRLPASARASSRTRRAATIAISDMAKKPFATNSRKMMRRSTNIDARR